MRLPSYRKHSSGRARVSINGRDYLLGPYGSKGTKRAWHRSCPAGVYKNGRARLLPS